MASFSKGEVEGGTMFPFATRPMLCLSTIVAAAMICAAAEPEKKTAPAPAELKVVKTIDELDKVEPVAAGEERVRLGIEATTCPAGSGVLVYCKAEDERGKRPQFGVDGIVGPVQAIIVYPGEAAP